MLNTFIPWWLKIGLKIVLARMPVNPHTFWRRMGIFKHGSMDEPSYAISNFCALLKFGDVSPENYSDKTILEVGPGDSVATGVIAAAYGMNSILVDIGDFATKNVSFYTDVVNQMNRISSVKLSLDGVTSFEEMAAKYRVQYLTHGTSSLTTINDASVDLVISQACLEHIAKRDFRRFVKELFRISAAGARHIHSIDFKDHLSYSLNNLRFSEKIWESKFLSSSGFYTNRLRYCEMRRIFTEAGFRVVVEEVKNWDELPIQFHKLHHDFQSYTVEELKIREVVIVFEK